MLVLKHNSVLFFIPEPIVTFDQDLRCFLVTHVFECPSNIPLRENSVSIQLINGNINVSVLHILTKLMAWMELW